MARRPVYVVTEDLAEQVTGFHVHRGALASLHREQRHSVEELLALQRLVVLEDIVDHTNVGAILRNAAGLGWDGALLSPRAADPLYRRSIKVSMGAVSHCPGPIGSTGAYASAVERGASSPWRSAWPRMPLDSASSRQGITPQTSCRIARH